MLAVASAARLPPHQSRGGLPLFIPQAPGEAVAPREQRSGMTKNGTMVPRPLGARARAPRRCAPRGLRRRPAPLIAPELARARPQAWTSTRSPRPTSRRRPRPSTLLQPPAPAPAPPVTHHPPSPNCRYTKDSIKGKLQDRFANNKKGKSTNRQAATLSVEGRTLDRV